jgi:hypothetical protein
MRHRTLAVLAAACALGGCHTITEELPTKPSNTGNLPTVNVPVPVIVTPVEIPTPAAPAPQQPSNPAPNPTSPSGGDDPPPNDGDGPDIPDNDAPVAKAIAKVFFIECGGGAIPGSGGATEAPVGCRVHLDVTPKDSSGKPTRAKHDPRWSYSNPSLFQVGGNSPYNPTLLVKAPGFTSAFAQVDGVRSNELNLRFN